MSGITEQAKAARAELFVREPEAVDAIDRTRQLFGARLTYLRVGDIEIGNRKAWDEIEALPPSARYVKPAQGKEEWRDIKEEIFSRDKIGRAHV